MSEEENSQEMEEWMQTWQLEVDGASARELREHFERRKVEKLMADLGGVGVYALASVALLAKAILKPGPIVITTAVFFIPYLLAEAWLLFRRWSVRRVSLPLSTREYVDALRHNLEIDRKQLVWEQRVLPVTTAVGVGLIAWILLGRWGTLPLWSVVFIMAVAAIGFGYALASTFIRKPASLARERAALEKLEVELREG